MATVPQASAPYQRYVNQNGNPVAPQQQPVVRYVDQNANRVSPQQQPVVRYVDQNGNPVPAPQQTAVQYVDQNGNPVAAPQQTAVRYVDQNGNPVSAPTAAPQQQSTQPTVIASMNVVTAPPLTKVTTNLKNSKSWACCLAFIALILLLAGLANDELSTGTLDLYVTEADMSCGWIGILLEKDGIPADFTSYADLCLTATLADTLGITTGDYCSTMHAAVTSKCLAIGAALIGLIASLFVAPCAAVAPCLCRQCALIMFAMAGVAGLSACIAWSTEAGPCLKDMDTGYTIWCFICGSLLFLIAAYLARNRTVVTATVGASALVAGNVSL